MVVGGNRFCMNNGKLGQRGGLTDTQKYGQDSAPATGNSQAVVDTNL